MALFRRPAVAVVGMARGAAAKASNRSRATAKANASRSRAATKAAPAAPSSSDEQQQKRKRKVLTCANSTEQEREDERADVKRHRLERRDSEQQVARIIEDKLIPKFGKDVAGRVGTSNLSVWDWSMNRWRESVSQITNRNLGGIV